MRRSGSGVLQKPTSVSAVFSAPVGLLSVNALPSQYPKEVLDHLKDINRLIVLEVSNPDDVFAVAQKQKLKILIDSLSSENRGA